MSGRNIQKYGQHFLTSYRVINDIVDASEVLRAQNLVEIGPGQGALTKELLKRGHTNFYAVEIDPNMVRFLQQELPVGAVQLIEANFLELDLLCLPAVPTQFISNLPYIDAAAILNKVLSWPYFKTAVFMFQKEQAQKITARPGQKEYGALAVLSQLRARISVICQVGKGCFNPPPKVDSRVLAFEKIEPPANWQEVAHVVQMAFLHRRKTLLNALQLGGYCKTVIQQALAQLSKSQHVRPEQLSPTEFVALSQVLHSHISFE